MRLWHQHLIHYLDSTRLLGQHRECCALRGNGWWKKHSVVDYVFKYDLAHLYAYHCIVMFEMGARHYNVNPEWYSRRYRGKTFGYAPNMSEIGSFVYNPIVNDKKFHCVYDEHDSSYLRECLLNLKSKNAELINGETIDHMLIALDVNGL